VPTRPSVPARSSIGPGFPADLPASFVRHAPLMDSGVHRSEIVSTRPKSVRLS
jgi:hypothetical protein